MALYTFHAPRSPGAGAASPAEVVAIKDGFCWPALFFPLIWTAWRRLWLVFLALLAAWLAINLLDVAGGGITVAVVYILGRIYYALEANGLRRWTLERRGWQMIGIAEGRTMEEAELRFFAEWSPEAPSAGTAPAPQAAAAGQPWRPASRNPQVVGLFPTPGTPR